MKINEDPRTKRLTSRGLRGGERDHRVKLNMEFTSHAAADRPTLENSWVAHQGCVGYELILTAP
jgi:hypothetical protein